MKFYLKGSLNDKLVVQPPPSKSYAQRALLAASLSEGRSRVILSGQEPDDVKVFKRALRSMGVKIRGDEVEGTIPEPPENVINMKYNGTGLRFMTAYSTLASKGYVVLTGYSSLVKRPVGPLVEAINELGGWSLALGEGGKPPVIVKGQRMKGGDVEIKASESSQYVSALLLVSPLNKERTKITWKNRVSEHYVSMTLWVMKEFGVAPEVEGESFIVYPGVYRASTFQVPADASSSSFFVSLSIMSEKEVLIKGLKEEPPQADLLGLTSVLEEAGIKFSFIDEGLYVYGKIPDKPIHANLKDSPDLFPALSVLGCVVPVKITGIEHIKYKESNRIASMASELSKLGCKVKASENDFYAEPGSLRKEAELYGWKDHRVVMALSVLCLSLGIKCRINGYEHVKKSFPSFFEELRKNGAEAVAYA